MKTLTATLLATAFAGLVAGTAHAAPQQMEPRDIAPNTVSAAGYQEDFINAVTPVAQAVQAEYRIPASVAAAQGIHESNWGRSTLTTNDKNYFGVKCSTATYPGPGSIATGCRQYQTTECTPDCHPATAYFRVYNSMHDSFRDYGYLLSRSGVYDYALPYRDNPDQFIREVAKRYATDPNYSNAIIQTMRTYDLYRLNTSTGSSLDGDGRAEIAKVGADGKVVAWRNERGFAATPYGASAIIATEFSSDNVKFADLDGDGRSEIIKVGADGKVVAWRNERGFAETPYGASAIIATEFTSDNVRFADLDGDRKAEIIKVGADGKVVAWRNERGFAETPYGASAIIATEFSSDNVHFGDLDGDGRAEIAKVGADGKVVAWRNERGFAETPYGAGAIIATEFTSDSVHFGDLDGDRKAEIVKVGADGRVIAWRNERGFADTPYGASAIIATDFTNDNLQLV
ncbi:glucosaminidase domain-containing protein [Lentzea sp. NPDC051838]|uniref:glucosaminidase domain-containing protein n=1 Tax=Lentzea sp. NPDC051838 TaxID=3154849 RepID=UPI003439E297